MAELPRIPIEAKLRPLDLKDRLLHHGVFERMILGGSLGVPAISLMSICQVYRSGKQPALMVRFMAAIVWNMWTYRLSMYPASTAHTNYFMAARC